MFMRLLNLRNPNEIIIKTTISISISIRITIITTLQVQMNTIKY